MSVFDIDKNNIFEKHVGTKLNNYFIESVKETTFTLKKIKEGYTTNVINKIDILKLARICPGGIFKFPGKIDINCGELRIENNTRSDGKGITIKGRDEIKLRGLCPMNISIITPKVINIIYTDRLVNVLLKSRTLRIENMHPVFEKCNLIYDNLEYYSPGITNKILPQEIFSGGLSGFWNIVKACNECKGDLRHINIEDADFLEEGKNKYLIIYVKEGLMRSLLNAFNFPEMVSHLDIRSNIQSEPVIRVNVLKDI